MGKNLQREEIEKIYGKISPFEFKNRLIELANGEKEKTARILLDAGRGNPNWTASTPREAFFTFGLFAVDETKKDINNGDLAGMPKKNGIYNRFIKFINKNNTLPGVELLRKIIEYGIKEKNFNADDYLYELADAIIGDNYPVPDRMLFHIEEIVHDYLVQEMCYNKPPSGKFDIFAVEGATAAMCYIFDTLGSNMLLNPKDKIAIMVPIFTPYLEIPVLPRYDLEIVPIKATETTNDGTHTWQYPLHELEKLKDNSIKALFIVNPSNPPSVSLSNECRKSLVSIIKEYNKDIMIISDDVYGTFVPEYRSLMADLPYNTIGVYSFSKYFGVTGWRLGTIAIHEKNIYNKLLKELSDDKKKILSRRYGDMKLDPETIPFIDRIVADSRQVALNHTAGLSTPQQVQMAFFCSFALLDDQNIYKKQTIEICHRRKKLLFDSLGLSLRKNIYDAAYYTEFDLLEWANFNYGSKFSNYLESNYKPVEVLYRLAEESSIVLLSGSGFQGPEWSIRISLANLKDEDYTTIGKTLHGILDEFVSRWKENSN
ncbi:aspartate 4-decarboxylase [Clostridium sp.]|uniref:aspartate 4-decarboxylase n=1 Tax=Clostridium sp. TaxID=1506 RepID=UPI0025C0DF31|nr:aspartate 4-decarboxylase [Clostridium sp.]